MSFSLGKKDQIFLKNMCLYGNIITNQSYVVQRLHNLIIFHIQFGENVFFYIICGSFQILLIEGKSPVE